MKSNLDKLFKTDAEVEKTGVWFNIDETTGFLVRRFSGTNPNAKAAMANHYKPYARQISLGTLSAEKEREISVKLFVDTCLVDWKGVEIDGQVVPFSKEAAVKLLLGLPELHATLEKHSSDFSNYKEELEEVGKS